MKLATTTALILLLGTVIGGGMTTAARADDCSTVRLDAPGGSMNGVMTYNQTWGSCFSYAAANMFNSYVQGHGGPHAPPHWASPMPTLLKYEVGSNAKDLDSLYGGHTNTIVNAMAADPKGSCDHGVFLGQGGVPLENYYKELERLYVKYQKNHKKDAAVIDIICATKTLSMPAELVDASAAAEALEDKTSLEFLTDMTESLCRKSDKYLPKDKLPKIPNVTEHTTKADFLSGINQSLNWGEAAGIGYCFYSLLDPNRHVGLPPSILNADDRDGRHPAMSKAEMKSWGSNCGPHASTIIGRKRGANGQCQYMIRDTHGTFCNRTFDIPGSTAKKSIAKDCENGKGNIWIDSDELMDNLYQVTTFDGP